MTAAAVAAASRGATRELVSDEHPARPRPLAHRDGALGRRAVPAVGARRSTAARFARAARSCSSSRSRLLDLERPVMPRGVLLVERLLSGKDSPLYARVEQSPRGARARSRGRWRRSTGRPSVGERIRRPPGQGRAKRLLVGRAMATGQMEETLLSKFLALPIFASDPLSSVAYATEAALVVLVGASRRRGASGVPDLDRDRRAARDRRRSRIARRCSSTRARGGAYIVAKENLGKLPSLVAAAALLTDYILTVAVSVAAGVLALTSAVTSLQGHELTLSLGVRRADHASRTCAASARRGSCSRSRRTRSSRRSSC